MNEDKNSKLEAQKQFNDFQSQSRARTETVLKLVMLTSGSMLTLSVGAVLNNSPQRIPLHLLSYLSWGWGFLFLSILFSLLVMVGMILATYHMGVQWGQKVTFAESTQPILIVTWPWLRRSNTAVGILAFVFCLAGVALMAIVAIGVAQNLAVNL